MLKLLFYFRYNGNIVWLNPSYSKARMNLNENIAAQRKLKGLTQQELATLCKVDLRTIQRIESGDSNPRAFTLKAIEGILGFQLITLQSETKSNNKAKNSGRFILLFCLSCFSYLVIPYVHFLIPNSLLRRNKTLYPEIETFANKVIMQQIYWVIATILAFLAVLLINFILRYYVYANHSISYMVPFFIMYGLNIILISCNIYNARTLAV